MNALYQTEKALQNFPFSYTPVHKELIDAIVEIKMAAAQTNKEIGHFFPTTADAIVLACQEILQGKFDDQFKLSGLQGGAGTSINMNVNEVIAFRAQQLLSRENKHTTIHPNDHVNKSQSTNDVNPSALKIAAIRLVNNLCNELNKCIEALEIKSKEYRELLKLGRTHLQDAVPITVGEEFGSYAEIIRRDKKRIENVLHYLYELNLGGTAVGNCINAPVEYRRVIYEKLAHITNLPIKPAENFMSQTSSQTDFVMLSQAVVAATLDLSKIANDIRLLASGPYGGFGEIALQELQSGSSIMPGKVNPVLPECVNQLYFLVSGNNITIEQAAHASQLELGVMFPIIADRLITSLKLSSEVIQKFTQDCLHTLEINKDACKINLEKSMAYATLLTPILGYDAVTSLVKEAEEANKTVYQLAIEKHLIQETKLNQLLHIKRGVSLIK